MALDISATMYEHSFKHGLSLRAFHICYVQFYSYSIEWIICILEFKMMLFMMKFLRTLFLCYSVFAHQHDIQFIKHNH